MHKSNRTTVGTPRLTVRKATTKTSSKERDDRDFQESDDDNVRDDEPLDGEATGYTVPSLPPEDADNLVKHFRAIEKQLEQLKAFLPESAKNQLGFQDKVAAGPASTTSSINGDNLEYYSAGDNIARLSAVVGDATRSAYHCQRTRHLSAVWIHNFNSYLAKNLEPEDRRDTNVLSCISRLLLHFYSRLSDGESREAVDEALELILGVFADIQARLMFPPDAAVTVVQSVKTQRYLTTAGAGDIHGIPAVLPERTSLVSHMHEKLAEDAFRATMKGNAKAAKVSDTETDFEQELKDMDTKIHNMDTKVNNLRRDHLRLAEICANHGLDTHTRREKDTANQQQKGEPQRRETQRADGQQHTTRLAAAARQTDNTEATPADEDNELTTKI